MVQVPKVTECCLRQTSLSKDTSLKGEFEQRLDGGSMSLGKLCDACRGNRIRQIKQTQDPREDNTFWGPEFPRFKIG
jgi:hypothetical protein